MSVSRHINDRAPADAFWSLVRVIPGNCWEWLGHKQQTGHGCWVKWGKRDKAYRWAYQFVIGPIPPKLFICHHCDNPSCCNPAHLYAGTHADNMRDMKDRGRAARLIGETHPMAIFTEPDVRAVRARINAGESHRVIALSFGVSRATISMIACGKNWSHIK
jgi:hypothetical protein